MAVAPKFLAPDGVLRSQYVFSTTSSSRFFTGTMDADTVDMQVSIRGVAFTSNPDLITFEGATFTIPNPSAFPDGLALLPGRNSIRVKSILTNGATTDTSTIDATLSLDSDVGVEILAPSGISLERFDGTVQIQVEGLSSAFVTGYNFYASVSPGGGSTGYSRINTVVVSAGTTAEALSTFGSLEVDLVKALNVDLTAAADPLYLAIRGQQQDRIGNVFQTDFNEGLVIPDTVGRFRVTTTVEQVTVLTTYSFTHDRQATFNSALNPAIPSAEFNSISTEAPLYYVVTAVYLVGTEEVESEFSPEVTGSPLVVSPNLGTFPAVSRQQIVRDTTLAIFRTQPQIATTPGSTTRDTFIDPFATEAERIRFVIDFTHNAQNLATLLRIDDPGLTGTSIPVSQSAYKLALKQALFLRTVAETQALIDRMFEYRAANFGLRRREGRRARGEVVFYTTRRPTSTISLPIGQQVSGGGFSFRTTSSAQITADGAGAFYDPRTGRYSVTVFVQADTPGVGGNLAISQINTVVGGSPGLQVTNLARTFGGSNQESNRDLAGRTIRTLSSVDSGRLQGYVKYAQDVGGVLQVNVVDAGHSLMLRDLRADMTHNGGKVDIWVRGESLARITDTFAFAFKIAREVQFVTVGDPRNLTLRAVDSNLSESNPIIEVLNNATLALGIRNATTGLDFDLTNVEIVSYDTVQLDTALNDPTALSLTDVLFGDYRYRESDRHVFERQPVRSIRTFTGQVTGTVSPLVYALYHPSSPLVLGRSAEAGDYVKVTQALTATGDTIPSGTPIVITGEAHVVLDGVEYVNYLGANPLTLRIFTPDRATEFLSPYDPSVQTGSTPDYTIIEGDVTTPLGIQLTSASAITAGLQVIFDYSHDENFSIEYTVNSLVGVVQNEIDTTRHITADVLVKEAVPLPVDIFGTAVVIKGASIPTVRASVRTNLANLFNALVLGEPLRQSDILGVIDGTEGVSYVVVPLAQVALANDAPIIRETLPSDVAADFFKITAWSTPLLDTYLALAPLRASTSNGGGPTNDFRGVFRDNVAFVHLDQAPNVNGVPLANAPNQEFIIGSQGMSIPGYSDDATLRAASPFATDEQIDTRRTDISADRVLVTVPKGVSLVGSSLQVTYTVQGDGGVRNIEPGPVSYLTLGTLDLTFDEDQNFADMITGRG